MRQRAMIAIALALSPALLIADEPTTALDVTVQVQIIELIKHLQDQFGTAVIMITHDLGIVATIAHEVMIMYAGKTMEQADRRGIYYEPHHPYTAGLLSSLPQSGQEGKRLLPIAGQPPSLINPPPGCPFHTRCAFAMPKCRSDVPPLRSIPGSRPHRSACWLPEDLVGVGPGVDTKRHEAAVVGAAPDAAAPAASP
jgi:oligopeptide/dipeptide ABC transporter ATP-binding protein